MVGNAIGASRNLKEVSRSERPVQQFFIEMSALFNALMHRRELRIYILSTKSMGGVDVGVAARGRRYVVVARLEEGFGLDPIR